MNWKCISGKETRNKHKFLDRNLLKRQQLQKSNLKVGENSGIIFRKILYYKSGT
jgi:hypothetical protein